MSRSFNTSQYSNAVDGDFPVYTEYAPNEAPVIDVPVNIHYDEKPTSTPTPVTSQVGPSNNPRDIVWAMGYPDRLLFGALVIGGIFAGIGLATVIKRIFK